MKYICDDERTLEYLQNWSQPKKLATASFYFWNAGDGLLKSQVGFLRSLLYQILRTDLDLVSHVCPNIYGKSCWTEEELIQALEDVARYMRHSAKLCFFIDGLDEFQGRESSPLQPEKQILQLLRVLMSCDNIKICASSRPWPVFENEFAANGCKLIVQEHTIGDMKRFASGMFMESIEFRFLAGQDSRYNDLADMVVCRGQGVWLWVFLVVRDMLKDISYEEDYFHLLNRIDTFPRLLTDYFKCMMERIDPIHREETAVIFFLIFEWHRTPLISLFFIDHLKNARFPADRDMKTIDQETCLKICKSWMKRLHSRCGDLVKISPGLIFGKDFLCAWNVGFLHRSVRDFLQENYRDRLLQWLPPNFNIHTTISRLALALIKAQPMFSYEHNKSEWKTTDSDSDALFVGPNEYGTEDSEVPDGEFNKFSHRPLSVAESNPYLVKMFLISAKMSEILDQPLDPMFIDELDRINSLRWTAKEHHWASRLLMASEVFRLSLPNSDGERTLFLALLVMYGLKDYLRQQLEGPDLLSQRQRAQLLFCTLTTYSDCVTTNEGHRDIHMDIADLLLTHGAEPSLEIGFLIEKKKEFMIHPRAHSYDSSDIEEIDDTVKVTEYKDGVLTSEFYRRKATSLVGNVWEYVIIDYWYAKQLIGVFDVDKLSDWTFQMLMKLAQHHPKTNIQFAYYRSDDSEYLGPLALWRMRGISYPSDQYKLLGVKDVIRMIFKPEQAQELFCVFDSVEREHQRVLGGCEKVAS